MSTKEEEFKERFIAVMRDLQENGRKDNEAMWMVGSFAARLIDLYKLKDWSQFKSNLTAAAYDRLLKDFEEQGNGYHKEGKGKAAYAVQLLATSVVARTQKDPEVRAGDKLLNEIISGMAAVYRKANAGEASKVH